MSEQERYDLKVYQAIEYFPQVEIQKFTKQHWLAEERKKLGLPDPDFQPIRKHYAI